MGRRKKNRAKNRKQPITIRRYTVPLAEWKCFERFKELSPKINIALNNLQEHFNVLVDCLQYDMDCQPAQNSLLKLVALIQDSDGEYKTKHKVPNRPQQKYQNMIAEIIIEEISDGKL